VVKETAVEQSPDASVVFNQEIFADELEQFKVLIKNKVALNDLIKHVVLSLHNTLGFSRVSFLVLSTDKMKLNAKINLIDNGADESVKTLAINLKIPNLFNLLMNKPQPFVLNDKNREKYWSKIPGDVKTQIHVSRFCATSVFYGAKPLGMIYADRMDEKITAELSSAFQTMTMMLNKGLELLAKQK
jgi:hypothetical protein